MWINTKLKLKHLRIKIITALDFSFFFIKDYKINDWRLRI